MGCGTQQDPLPGADGVVVKSRQAFVISTQGPSDAVKISENAPLGMLAMSGSIPVSVNNALNTSMALDTSQFIVPVISNALIDFGSLKISALMDNNLNLCGPSANQHCGTALIRMYTVGTAGAGIWNDTDQFGAPITAGPSSQTVGLNVAGAAVLRTFTIPKNKHVIRLADFSPPVTFNVKADFTEAGMGTYSTTLVLEYGLAP